jgi:hypothetical protein
VPVNAEIAEVNSELSEDLAVKTERLHGQTQKRQAAEPVPTEASDRQRANALTTRTETSIIKF